MMKLFKHFNAGSFYQKYKDLILLIVGFFLTTLIGTTIAFHYQQRQQALTISMEQLRLDREAASAAATDISELIGRHHFNALQLSGAIETYIEEPTPENLAFLNEQSATYRSSTREWNTSWNKNRARLRMLFGTDFEARFYTHADIDKVRYERSLTGLFNAMHADLVSAKAEALSKKAKKSYDFTKFDDTYHAIGYLSYEFFNDLIRQTQQGAVGSFNKAPLEMLAPTYAFPSINP